MLNIAFFESDVLGNDLDLSPFEALGNVSFYGRPSLEEVADIAADADIIIVSKIPMNRETLARADHLKLISVEATGTNNLDKDYLAERKIAWTNIEGYATESVAQHTFAMLFYLLEKLPYYDRFVKSGSYAASGAFCHIDEPFFQLKGKTWGIIGLGAIGRRVADLAKAFGCRVIYHSASGAAPQEGYDQVSFEEILKESDILSVHAPLNEHTLHLMDREAFRQMKPSSIFINVGRGPIVVESDLAAALSSGEIAAAGLDVMEVEPPAQDNPLLAIKDSSRLLITPHIAWASRQAREDLVGKLYRQVRDFIETLN